MASRFSKGTVEIIGYVSFVSIKHRWMLVVLVHRQHLHRERVSYPGSSVRCWWYLSLRQSSLQRFMASKKGKSQTIQRHQRPRLRCQLRQWSLHRRVKPRLAHQQLSQAALLSQKRRQQQQQIVKYLSLWLQSLSSSVFLAQQNLCLSPYCIKAGMSPE